MTALSGKDETGPGTSEPGTEAPVDQGSDRQCVRMVKAREPELGDIPGWTVVHVNNDPSLRIDYVLNASGQIHYRRCRNSQRVGSPYCKTHTSGTTALQAKERREEARDKALETIITELDSPDPGVRVRAAKVALDYVGKDVDESALDNMQKILAQFEARITGNSGP